mgnify:CR=1 FL=1
MAPCSSSADAQHPNDVFGRLFRACEGLPAVRCAVVHPCDADSLGGAIAAAQRGLIVPVLVGPQAKIRAVAKEDAYVIDANVSFGAAAYRAASGHEGPVQVHVPGGDLEVTFDGLELVDAATDQHQGLAG